MLAILLFAFFFVAVPHVNAYLDPGNGSYVIQLIAGGILGLLVSIRLFYKQITEFLKRVFHGK